METNKAVIQKTKSSNSDSSGVFSLLTRREQHRFINMQHELLEMIALGKPLKQTLARLAGFIESHTQDIYCALLLLDDNGEQLRLGAAPSLPSSFIDAIDGMQIGPDQGSCGSAAYLRKPVISNCIRTDPIWKDYRDWIIGNYGIVAAWSYPVFCSKKNLLGTFAMYSQSMRSPTARDEELIQVCTHLAGIAIERHCDQLAATKAREKAEEASLAKSLFLANISHELRTPLNAILGYTDLLHEELGTEVSPQAQQDLKQIETAGRHLLDMITSIMDVCHLETGKIELKRQMFDACQIVNRSISTHYQSIIRGNNQINWRPNQKPQLMHNDARMLAQIINNLVDNACKFCQDGVISVDVNRSGDVADDKIVITVSDTGVGIAPDKQKSIFEAFTQADISPTREFQGMGMGLAICAGYAKLMGGNIDVNSNPGQGTTFTVTLPTNLGI